MSQLVVVIGGGVGGIVVANRLARRARNTDILVVDSHGEYIGRFSTARRAEEASRPVDLVATEDGDVLVVDHGDQRGLRRFGIGGEPRDESGHTAENVEEPIAAARDEAGRVYVLDRGGERVLRFHPDLTFEAVIVDLAEIVLDL